LQSGFCENKREHGLRTLTAIRSRDGRIIVVVIIIVIVVVVIVIIVVVPVCCSCRWIIRGFKTFGTSTN